MGTEYIISKKHNLRAHEMSSKIDVFKVEESIARDSQGNVILKSDGTPDTFEEWSDDVARKVEPEELVNIALELIKIASWNVDEETAERIETRIIDCLRIETDFVFNGVLL